jgi:hypothetical protein
VKQDGKESPARWSAPRTLEFNPSAPVEMSQDVRPGPNAELYRVVLLEASGTGPAEFIHSTLIALKRVAPN